MNHEGSIDRAEKLIVSAARGGADGVKFQTYKADLIAIKDSPSYWDLSEEATDSQYKLFSKYDSFGSNEYQRLHNVCVECGVDFLSTPFDLGAVEMLSPYVPFFKIASADITNLPLIRKVAASSKPVVISSGASSLAEIAIAVSELEAGGCRDICVMHCVLNYPTECDNANLAMLASIHSSFPDVALGYSDHTKPEPSLSALTSSWLLGAKVIEKHFTLDKSLKGNDHYHSMDEMDLINLQERFSLLSSLVGSERVKRPLHSEQLSRVNARRGIVAKGDLKKGDLLSENNLICKRPVAGIAASNWDAILGAELLVDLENDQPITWDLVKLAR